jgi:hypothetical protein
MTGIRAYLCTTCHETGYCQCEFPHGVLVHVNTDVTFCPNARLCRVGTRLFKARSFMWGYHDWITILRGLVIHVPHTIELARVEGDSRLGFRLRWHIVHAHGDRVTDSILFEDVMFPIFEDGVLVTTHVRRMQRAIRRYLSKRRLALAMAMHARLGQHSALQALSVDILRHVILMGV